MIDSLIISLILAVIIEVFVALILGVRKEHNLETVVWVNCITNPIVVFITNTVFYFNNRSPVTYITLIILEILVIPVEGLIYKKNLDDTVKINPYKLSLIANVISFIVGEIIDIIAYNL